MYRYSSDENNNIRQPCVFNTERTSTSNWSCLVQLRKCNNVLYDRTWAIHGDTWLMAFDIPFNIFALYIGMATTIGIVGVVMASKKIDGAPFVTIFAGGMMFSLTVLVGNITMGESEDYITNDFLNNTSYMNQPTVSGTSALRSGSNIFFGEKVVNEQSLLNGGREMNTVQVRLSKTGSPTGNFIVGVYNGVVTPTASNYKYLVASVDSSSLTTSQTFYTYYNRNATYILQPNDVVGVFYNGGSAGNEVNIASNATASSFDGVNSIRSLYTSSWSDSTTADLTGKIGLIKIQIQELHPNDNYAFNMFDVWAFIIVMGAFWMLLGGMMQISKW